MALRQEAANLRAGYIDEIIPSRPDGRSDYFLYRLFWNARSHK